jgi:hypothetical protein
MMQIADLYGYLLTNLYFYSYFYTQIDLCHQFCPLTQLTLQKIGAQVTLGLVGRAED